MTGTAEPGPRLTPGDDEMEADPLWCVVLDGFDPEVERVREVLAVLADGSVGVSGSTLAQHEGRRDWTVACGVYDGDGPETQLLQGPVALHLPYRLEPGDRLRRVLDLRSGTLAEHADCDAGPVRSVRFASLAAPCTIVMRAHCPDDRAAEALRPPSAPAQAEQGTDADVVWMSVNGTSQGCAIVAAAHETRTPGAASTITDRVVAYAVDGTTTPDHHGAIRRARAAAGLGFDRLLAEHRRAWSQRWETADIRIEGDDELQLDTRFALFHLMGSVGTDGEAPVGARGLTGLGYRGHVFWDADTFTLPFLAATCPSAARAMLEYRIRRLPAARLNAAASGRAGARFPWESAWSGADVTPRSARDRTGRLVPIRTGLLEEHIVAQVPWAARCYVDWTGDEEFALGHGARLLVETARYWASRVRHDRAGAAHIYGVIGPDEYHEPVDDNAFTNVMARWNLRAAADAVEQSAELAAEVRPDELDRWRRVADALVDGYDPDTGRYEQFAGFNRLEPMLIADIAPRRPIAADLLLGAKRVAGAQVVKQADVVMLHHLLPDEVAPGSLEPNLRFYEPRTAHGSSLSPPIHAALFARIGDYERALHALRIAARMDRDDLTGSTSSGLHFATMGGLWQALALGFAGLRPTDRGLVVDPHLPPDWDALEVRVQYRGSRLRIRADHAELTIQADRPAAVVVDSTVLVAGPGDVRLLRRGSGWEVAR